MKTTKLKSYSFEKIESTSFDAEVLGFWGERARIKLSYMEAMVAYLD